MPEHGVYDIEQRLLFATSAQPIQGEALDAIATSTPLPVRGVQVSAEASSVQGDSGLPDSESRPEHIPPPQVRPPVRNAALRDLICSFSWACETALRIIECESRFDPEAVSYDGEDFGLMQLNAETWAPIFPGFWDRWMEPEWNVRTGYEIYKRAGYSFVPWECY